MIRLTGKNILIILCVIGIPVVGVLLYFQHDDDSTAVQIPPSNKPLPPSEIVDRQREQHVFDPDEMIAALDTEEEACPPFVFPSVQDYADYSVLADKSFNRASIEEYSDIERYLSYGSFISQDPFEYYEQRPGKVRLNMNPAYTRDQVIRRLQEEGCIVVDADSYASAEPSVLTGVTIHSAGQMSAFTLDDCFYGYDLFLTQNKDVRSYGQLTDKAFVIPQDLTIDDMVRRFDETHYECLQAQRWIEYTLSGEQVMVTNANGRFFETFPNALSYSADLNTLVDALEASPLIQQCFRELNPNQVYVTICSIRDATPEAFDVLMKNNGVSKYTLNRDVQIDVLTPYGKERGWGSVLEVLDEIEQVEPYVKALPSELL